MTELAEAFPGAVYGLSDHTTDNLACFGAIALGASIVERHFTDHMNRQGPDIGTQYRSNIFYVDETQKRIAQAYIAQLDKAKLFPRAIVTRVDALSGFYTAEAYHQDFLLNNPFNPYILIHDLPKIGNLKRVFPARYREQPITSK